MSTPIPANYMVTFRLWLKPNDIAVGYDTCRFQTDFTLNLNPQTGIGEAHVFSAITVNPNPASDKVIFSSANHNVEIFSIRFFNLEGQQLVFTELNPEQAVDVSCLSNGMYLIRVSTSSGNSNFKVIKE